MKHTLLFLLLLQISSAFGQSSIQTFQEYSLQHGRAAIEKKYAEVNRRGEASRTGFTDYVSYTIKKEAEAQSLFPYLYQDELLTAEVYLWVEQDGSPGLLLYQVTRMDQSFKRASYNLSESEKVVLKKVFGESLARIDFSHLPRDEKGIVFYFQSSKKIAPDSYKAVLENLPDTTSSINLSGYRLREIPQEIYRFKNLRKLKLSDNLLSEIPRKLWKIKTLEELDLSQNILENTSLELRRNKRINSLNLQFNQLSQAPLKIHKLRNMQELFLGNNFLPDFERQKLKRIRNLKNLNLYKASLTDLPASLKKSRRLEHLDLYYNRMQAPEFDFSGLKKLRTLAISYNEMWRLPETVGRLEYLEKLYAHHNKLNRLPELSTGIRLLDVGYNDFIKVPEWIGGLENLEEADFSNCKLEELPLPLSRLPNLRVLTISNNPLEFNTSQKDSYKKLVSELKQRSVDVR
jgi:Leucine-rich repeat (LRR) protein